MRPVPQWIYNALVRRLVVPAAFVTFLLTVPLPAQPQPASASLDDVLRRMGEYVSSYGEQASVIVAVEKYTQTLTSWDGGTFRPRHLVAELAMVKTGDEGEWTGFRDVVQVDGTRVVDRQDRLRSILTKRDGTLTEARRLADESSRFNVGPVIRNFNVPTTALFFLSTANQPRFSFTRKGEKTVDGVSTWEVTFRETKRPTLVKTRAGKDVPCEGSVWVVPTDGTIVRTRLSLRRFADVMTQGDASAPSIGASAPDTPPVTSPPTPQSPAPQPGGNTGGTGPGTPPPASPPEGSGNTGVSGTTGGSGASTSGASAPTGGPDPGPARGRPRFVDSLAQEPTGLDRIESEASIEVTYRRDDRFAMWLPARMAESYSGAIPRVGRAPVFGQSRSVATYSDYKRFETSAQIVEPTPR